MSISVAGHGLFGVVSARPTHGDRLPSTVQGIKSKEETKEERVPSLISSEGHLGQLSQPFCVVFLNGCSINGRAQEQRFELDKVGYLPLLPKCI